VDHHILMRCYDALAGVYRASQKKRPQKSKKKVFFTKTFCQGMKVIVFGKSNRPRGPRPVEKINFEKNYSRKESKTNGKSAGR